MSFFCKGKWVQEHNYSRRKENRTVMKSLNFEYDVLRPLGAVEKAFWLLDQRRPGHFCMVAQILGKTTVDTWRSALQKVGSQVTFASVQITAPSGAAPCFVKVASRSVPLTVATGRLDGWEKHVAIELAQRFDVESDPLIRARLLLESGRAILILSLHNSIADGTSGAILLRDIVRVAGGQNIVFSTETAYFEEVLGGTQTDDSAPRSEDQHLPALHFATSATRPMVLRQQLSVDETSLLRVTSRKEGATVHGALCAAAVLSFMRLNPLYPIKPPRVLIPIDIRNRSREVQSQMGVYLSGAMTRVQVAEPDFWDQAREFSKRMRIFRDSTVLAREVEILERQIEFVTSPGKTEKLWTSKFGAEILMANLGEISSGGIFGNLVVSGIWGPAISTGIENEQSISAVSVAGRMNLLCTSPDGDARYLDVFVESLKIALVNSNR